MPHTVESRAASLLGSHRGGATMREGRLSGLAYAKAWRERGGAEERWKEYTAAHGLRG